MAARKELEQLQSRKERLIRQNEIFRRHLRIESDYLRDAAEWIERGHSFYRIGMKIRSWSFSNHRANPLKYIVGIGRFFG